MKEKLKAPFPYFGGKSNVADVVWKRLGSVKRYFEPFFGSGAVMLGRPDWKEGVKLDEIVNDYDCLLTNAWRSIKLKPEEVAEWCDWPVSHLDMMARQRELIRQEENIRQKLIDDAEWCDPKLGAYWIYGMSCWIGGEFPCKYDKIPQIDHKIGISQFGGIPRLTAKQGISKTFDKMNVLDSLRTRLENVYVVCGDWKRCMGGDWIFNKLPVGFFFDPPYSADCTDVYKNDSNSVSKEVEEWCKENGDRNGVRIALAGYDGEHNDLEGMGWKTYHWKANGGYANQGEGRGRDNAKKETIWFSPNCIDPEAKRRSFF